MHLAMTRSAGPLLLPPPFSFFPFFFPSPFAQGGEHGVVRRTGCYCDGAGDWATI